LTETDEHHILGQEHVEGDDGFGREEAFHDEESDEGDE
jgi:hypothetical protein